MQGLALGGRMNYISNRMNYKILNFLRFECPAWVIRIPYKQFQNLLFAGLKILISSKLASRKL